MSANLKDHWNKKYATTPRAQLGWYEEKPHSSLGLIEKCGVPKHQPILDVGSGTSALISNLLDLGYQNIYGLDISNVALDEAKQLLSDEQAGQVHWVDGDITRLADKGDLPEVAIWHDRAVFHFLTDDRDRESYLSTICKVLMKGGFLIIATFSLDGAEFCSGLPVKRYSVDSLGEFFGKEFELLEGFDTIYQMPSGDTRPYTFCRFQKIKK